MEAPELLRGSLRVIIIFIVLGCAYPLPAYEYELAAHAALTASIVEGYNAGVASNDISSAHRFLMIRGSVEEDKGTRSKYHFYDPIDGRGLTYAGKTWTSAVKWAHSGDNSYTWDAALRAYAQGDDQAAFLALGHVLHLLEDMGVPEHARNDAHPVASPYESFTKSLVPQKFKGAPASRSSVDDYLKAMAVYSNSNFYSADSIAGTKYMAPKPDYFKNEGEYEYAFKNLDKEKYRLALVVGEQFNYFRNIKEKVLAIQENSGEKKILSDYWRLLSREVVRNGVGLTALFIAEGEKLRAEELAKEKARPKGQVKGVMASVLDTLLPGAPGEEDEGDGLIEDDPVSISSDDATPAGTAPSPSKAAAKKKTAGAGDEAVKPGSGAAGDALSDIAFCAYEGGGSPRRISLIINEIAWMGSRASATDEWIELKNIGTAPLNLSGWQVISQKGRVREILPHAVLAPGAFYLLERTSDASAPNAKADRIYQGSLSNTNDGLRLFDPSCASMDEAFASPSWPAGNAAERRTMERGAAFSWHDYSGAGSSGIFGTPKRENSIPAPVVAKPPPSTAVGGSSPSPAASASPSPSVAPSTTPGTAVINEFLFDAVGADAGREFIELYNPTDFPLDLAGWSLQTQSAKKNFEDGNGIPAKGCFLVVLGSGGTLTPGMRWASGSLNNTSGTIYLSKDQAFVSGDIDPNIVDRVTYSNAVSGFSPGMSLERGDSASFRVRTAPNPGDCSRETQAPSHGSPSSSGAPFGAFFASAYFYKDPLGDGSVIDIHFNSYPFIPGTADRWKALVFYLNSDPGTDQSLDTAHNWASADSHAIQVRYPVYCTGCEVDRPSLILPDTAAQSGSGGGLHNVAYRHGLIGEDKMIRLRAPLAHAGDYITIGYYDFSSSGGGSQDLSLVLADPTRYHFADPEPSLSPPLLTGSLGVSFDSALNLLTLTGPTTATDPDSPDFGITYSFLVNGTVLSTPYFGSGTYSFFVTFGDDLEIQYQAKDEFGIGSIPLSDEWAYPGAITWKLVQDKADRDSAPLGLNGGGCASCFYGASFQGISFSEDTQADVFAMRLSSGGGVFDSKLHFMIQGDQGGVPDGVPIVSKSTPFAGAVIDPTRDIMFVLDQPVDFKKDMRYWLFLDSEVESGDASRYTPHIRHRISSASDEYSGGSAGFFASGEFVPNRPTASSDWYMKIGLREP